MLCVYFFLVPVAGKWKCRSGDATKAGMHLGHGARRQLFGL